MYQQDIEKTLPKGVKLPKAISHICSFADDQGYPISGCFELSAIGMEDMEYWFKSRPEAVKELIPFGRGAKKRLFKALSDAFAAGELSKL